MPGYMPQRVFNMCAVSAAKISAETNRPVEDVAAEIAELYIRTYDDSCLAQEIAQAATRVCEFMQRAMPPNALISTLTQMQFCIRYYHPSGKRMRRKVFGGTLFTKERAPIPKKEDTCAANIATFHVLVINERIPLAPNGWSF